MLYDDQIDQALFIAGQYAPAGQYRRIDSEAVIRLDREDILPASLDGKVASYILVQTRGQTPPAGTLMPENAA